MFSFGFYSILLQILLKSIARFTQIYYRIYSNLLPDLLKSITRFTQIYCRIYSILRTNLLNSPYSRKEKSVKFKELAPINISWKETTIQ